MSQPSSQPSDRSLEWEQLDLVSPHPDIIEIVRQAAEFAELSPSPGMMDDVHRAHNQEDEADDIDIKIEPLERHRTSAIWNHMPDSNPQTMYYNDQGHPIWKCMHCSRVYKESGGTRIVIRHLRQFHSIDMTSPRQEKRKRVGGAIEKAMGRAAETGGYKRRRLEVEAVEAVVKDEYKIDPNVLELLFVRWIACDSIPLASVESDEFRAILTYISKDINTWLPSSANTVRKWVIRTFEAEKKSKIAELAAARSKIHISCDLATSTNNLPIMAIIANYVSADGVLSKALLSLTEVDGEHTHDNLARHMIATAKEYEICEKLGYFVMDNASVNDAMMRDLSACKSI